MTSDFTNTQTHPYWVNYKFYFSKEYAVRQPCNLNTGINWFHAPIIWWGVWKHSSGRSEKENCHSSWRWSWHVRHVRSFIGEKFRIIAVETPDMTGYLGIKGRPNFKELDIEWVHFDILYLIENENESLNKIFCSSRFYILYSKLIWQLNKNNRTFYVTLLVL